MISTYIAAIIIVSITQAFQYDPNDTLEVSQQMKEAINIIVSSYPGMNEDGNVLEDSIADSLIDSPPFSAISEDSRATLLLDGKDEEAIDTTNGHSPEIGERALTHESAGLSIHSDDFETKINIIEQRMIRGNGDNNFQRMADYILRSQAATSPSCWTCSEDSYDDCYKQGELMKCNISQKACFVKVREQTGRTIKIEMGCQSTNACQVDKNQNFQIEGTPSRFDRCRASTIRAPSDCHHCCFTDGCNRILVPESYYDWVFNFPYPFGPK